MPYGVRKRGKKWQVYNRTSGKSKGSHGSKGEAEAHRRALYANEPDARKPRYRKPKTKRKKRRKG